MIRDFKFLIFVILLGGTFSFLMMYLSFKNGKTCDELVIMNDGSQIEATEVTSYDNGMSTIKMCGGEWMDTPTLNIKMVKPNNK
jgi:hypothetical protein